MWYLPSRQKQTPQFGNNSKGIFFLTEKKKKCLGPGSLIYPMLQGLDFLQLQLQLKISPLQPTPPPPPSTLSRI